MKKCSALLLSLLLCISLIVPASAAGQTVTVTGGDNECMAAVTFTNVIGQGEVAIKDAVYNDATGSFDLVDATIYVYQMAPGAAMTISMTEQYFPYGALYSGGSSFYKLNGDTYVPFEEESGYEGQMMYIGSIDQTWTRPLPLEYTAATDICGFWITGDFYVYFTCNPNLKFITEDQPTAPAFTDVPAGAYYADAVAWAVEQGITNGTSPTTFGPTETCTRGQVATFLWRAKGCPEPTATVNPFTDVKENDYFYKAVLWAVEQGITNGTSPTTFGPNETCTSAHVVTFLWRANGKPAAETAGTEYYAEAVAWGNANALLAGTAVPFAPGNLSPRADIVTYLYRDAH